MNVTLTATTNITAITLHPSPDAEITAGPSMSGHTATFSAHRIDFGSWLVGIDVTDSCGVWHTFAGFGS